MQEKITLKDKFIKAVKSKDIEGLNDCIASNSNFPTLTFGKRTKKAEMFYI
ncbi:MAG: hypothetical protein MRQ09_00115 [Candidatus Midichloria sp.]|nr:hypothetical protein [Candidatus Midichloria sp.]